MLNPLSNAFGLDIGDRSYKLSQLKKIKGKQQYKLTAWSSIDVPEGVMDSGTILDKQKAVSLIEQLVKKATGRVRGRAVVACLPEAKTFIKIINTDEDGLNHPNRTALKEIEQNIPLPKEEIYYDYQIIDNYSTKKIADKKIEDSTETEEVTDEKLTGKIDPEKSKKILLGAAPKDMVDSYVELLDSAGLAPIALEIEATAINRCVIPKSNGMPEALGILDIGATRSSLIIHDKGMIQMSISIPIAGDLITKTISDALNLSLSDAELLKRECGLDSDRCEDKIWKVLQTLIDDMAQKIRNALRFYKIGFPDGKNIEHLYVCGGGAHFRKIENVLSRMLTIKVERANALANITSAPKSFTQSAGLSFTTAIGLGIRASEEASNKMNRLR